MLTVMVPEGEWFDESTQTFITFKGAVLNLEHSLASLSKWESIVEKPFLGTDEKTPDQILLYVKCMTFPEEADSEVYERLTQDNLEAINYYINAKMSATWFAENPNEPRSREVVTAELIYYWMVSFNIPIECERWHLNRLITLIRICNAKNSPAKKMSSREVGARQRDLNAQRRAMLGTRG